MGPCSPPARRTLSPTGAQRVPGGGQAPLLAARCCRSCREAPAPPHLHRSGPDAAASLCAGPWAGRGRAALGAAEGPGTRHSPPAPLRRNRKDAAGPTRAEAQRASGSGPRTVGVRGERGRAGPGRSGLARYCWVTAGFGPAGAAGSGPEGAYKKLGGGSWDIAVGLPRRLSVHETNREAFKSVLLLFCHYCSRISYTCPVLLGVDQRRNTRSS